MKIIGIAGGSGAGKSTVSYALEDEDPENIEVLNFDDCQKVGTDETRPMIDGMTNWDHPDIIRWDDLLRDIKLLKSGQTVTVNVWSHRSNPDYATHRKMKPRTIQPKPILIVEGYLALYNAKLRELFDTSFYLDVRDEVRNKRRAKNNYVAQDDYEDKVLIPMHKKYVEPTKEFADYVVDVSDMSVEHVCDYMRNRSKL